MIAASERLDGQHEGWVVTFEDGFRFKLKGNEYLQLMKIRMDCTHLKIEEELLKDINISLESILSTKPEEFHKLIQHWYFHYKNQMIKLTKQVVNELIPLLKLNLERKQLGLLLNDTNNPSDIISSMSDLTKSLVFISVDVLGSGIIEQLPSATSNIENNDDRDHLTSNQEINSQAMIQDCLLNDHGWRLKMWQRAKKFKLVQSCDIH